MYLVYKYPKLFVDNPYDVYLLGKSPGFWYNLIYTTIVCVIAAQVVIMARSPYKKGKAKKLNPYQRNKFISIFFVQLILFFVLPYIIPGMKNQNGFFDDRKFINFEMSEKQFKQGDDVYQIGENYTLSKDSNEGFKVISKDSENITLQAQKAGLFGHQENIQISATDFTFNIGDTLKKDGYRYGTKAKNEDDFIVGKIDKVEGNKATILVDPTVNKNAYVYVYNGFTSAGGFFYIFILVPLSVWFFGKRYCSWFCACGNLAETIGITKWGAAWVRHYTPRGKTARSLEKMQYVFLVWGIVFGFILFVDTWKLFTVGDLTTMMRVYQDIVVDLMFGALIGVGAYPFLGTRIWCRYGCPLAAGMRIYGKFSKSKFDVVASEKCTGIGECTQACPMGINVEDYAHKDKKPINGNFGLDTTPCIGCGGCIDICPVNALEFKYPVKSKPQEVSK